MTIPTLDLANFTAVDMDFADPKWRASIPSQPGWYAIETNAPVAVLAKCPLPALEGKHYKIAKRTEDAKFLIEQGVAIAPRNKGAPYIVYSGEHGNLKARAREHAGGNKGTGCLALHQYDIASAYTWTFYYLTCAAHVPGCEGNKMLRNYLEQRWRADNGWPVLCSR
ncbi:MAG: hypothetical protein K2X55_07440 [Burkholderiaceae bacterium]|nr:hypothetical protein [Burkholderiaceae bacterium]